MKEELRDKSGVERNTCSVFHPPHRGRDRGDTSCLCECVCFGAFMCISVFICFRLGWLTQEFDSHARQTKTQQFCRSQPNAVSHFRGHLLHRSAFRPPLQMETGNKDSIPTAVFTVNSLTAFLATVVVLLLNYQYWMAISYNWLDGLPCLFLVFRVLATVGWWS